MRKSLGKIISLILGIVLLVTALPISVYAQSFDIIGSVVSTDIRAYINGAEIPAYAINGSMVILGADLRNYGFNVVWDGNARTSSVSYSGNDEAWNPITEGFTRYSTVGEKVMNVYDTDIVVFVNGAEVPAYAVDGKMAFKFSELKVFGNYYYDNASRTTNLWIEKNSDNNFSSDSNNSASNNMQGYWNYNTVADGWLYDQYYNFNGNNYSCAERWYTDSEGNNLLFTIYHEGTFKVFDGMLTMTRTLWHSYWEGNAQMATNLEETIQQLNISDNVLTRVDYAEERYNQFKNYVLERVESSESSESDTTDYSYLAKADFRSIHRDYPEAVGQCAYVYAYTDLNGDLCVLSTVKYKIISNWDVLILHNLTQGTQISDPANYYMDISNQYYGANKIHYMDLSTEVLNNYLKMTQALISIMENGINTFDGVYVSASELNQYIN